MSFKMKRSSISKIYLSSFCVLPLFGFAQERPHIILIFTDQQNVNAMSAAGNPYLYTPNMDALASDGIRFTNAYCTSPVSGPSRASMVTGLMAREAGVEWNDNSKLGEEVQTIGDLLSVGGYRTVWAGKWHIPEIYPQRSKDCVEHLHGFELLPFWDAPGKHWLLGAETDPPLTSAVVSFLDSYGRDEKPLFLAISYHNPHDICMYPRKIGWETKSDSLLTIRPFGEYKLPKPMGVHPDSLSCLPPLPGNFIKNVDEPEFIIDKRIKPNPYGDEVQLSSQFSEKEWQAYLNSYYRLTELVDMEVGKVIDALKRNGMYENSLIIFTSDHGDGMAAHEWSAKLSFYEESVKVPMIMVLPEKWQQGAVNSNLVSLVDLVPTFCDYAKVDSKANFAGMSLRRAVLPAEECWRDFVVAELADHLKDRTRKGRMIRTGRYKYTIYSSGGRNEQLFDLLTDPGETINLAYSKAYREILEKHRNLLGKWMEERNDNFKVVTYEK